MERPSESSRVAQPVEAIASILVTEEARGLPATEHLPDLWGRDAVVWGRRKL